MIIASSLPPSWDTFTEPYVRRHVGLVEIDPKKLQFIGILKEEYMKHKEWIDDGQKAYYVSSTSNNGNNGKNGNRPLANCMQGKDTGMLCRNCGHNTHTTDNCWWLGQPKCEKCGWFGHVDADCHRQSSKRKNSGKSGRPPKKAKKGEVHHIAENSIDDEEDELDELAGNEEGQKQSEIVFSATVANTSCNVDGQNDNAMICWNSGR
jgi:hypothetical protein